MSPNITRFGFIPKHSFRGFFTPASRRMGGFVLDMSEVQRRMDDLDYRVLPSRIRAGLTAAGNRLMIDAVLATPTMPIHRPQYGGTWTSGRYGESWTASEKKAGELRASGALFVDGVKKRTTTHYGEFATGKYQPEVYGGTPIDKMSHEACVVFNAPYAAEQHEAWPEKTQPGAGMKYLGNKLYANAPEYIAIVVEAIKL